MQAPNYTNLFLHNARYLSLYTVKVLLLTEQQERHSEQECKSRPDHHHTDVDLKFRKTSRYLSIKQLGYDSSEHLDVHCIVKLIIVTEKHYT